MKSPTMRPRDHANPHSAISSVARRDVEGAGTDIDGRRKVLGALRRNDQGYAKFASLFIAASLAVGAATGAALSREPKYTAIIENRLRQVVVQGGQGDLLKSQVDTANGHEIPQKLIKGDQWYIEFPGTGVFRKIRGATRPNYSFRPGFNAQTGVYHDKVVYTLTNGQTLTSKAHEIVVLPLYVVAIKKPLYPEVEQGQSHSFFSFVKTEFPYVRHEFGDIKIESIQWFAKAPGSHSYHKINGADLAKLVFNTNGTTELGTWNLYVRYESEQGSVHLARAKLLVYKAGPPPQEYTVTVVNDGCVSASGSGTFITGQTDQISAVVPSHAGFAWTGQGPGSYTGVDNPATITIQNGNITEIANCTIYVPTTTTTTTTLPPPSPG